MAGLMDYLNPTFGGFNQGISDNRNSLIGLGLGLLAPSYPTRGESPWSNALQGFQGGAGVDAANQRYRQQLAQHQADRAQAQSNADRAFGLQQRQFEEANWQPGTYKDANTEQDYPYQQNRRTGETRWLFGKPPSMGGGTQAAGGVGYGQAGVGQAGFGTGSATTEPGAPPATSGAFAPSSLPSSSPYQAPPGMLPSQAKEYRQEMAKQTAKSQIANQEDAVKSAKAAAEMKPAIDEMVAAYKDLIKGGGIGPVVGSGVGREVQAVTRIGAGNETVRQRYDTALAKVKALVTAAQNKGEGQVSNFERQMYGAQFPSLTALDPQTQLPFLLQLQKATEQTVNTGRNSLLGAPGPFDRPEINQKNDGWTDLGNGIRIRQK
jgi:hypothetical protein